MEVLVNGNHVSLLPGMKIRHALLQSGLLGAAESGNKVYDQWGNELGLDGSVTEGMAIIVSPGHEQDFL